MKIISIGREQGNDIIINNNKISRHHCQIIQTEDNRFIVNDCNSSNGTFVNGVRIFGEQNISIGDKIMIGDTVIPWQSYFENVQNISSPQQPSRKKSKVGLIIGISAAAMVLLVGGGIILLLTLGYLVSSGSDDNLIVLDTTNITPNPEPNYENFKISPYANSDVDKFFEQTRYKNVPTPTKILYKVTQSYNNNWDDLFNKNNISKDLQTLVTSCDFSNKTVRNLAVKIAGKSQGEFNIGQICNIFDYCYDNWKYVNDPPTEEYNSKASESIENGFNGDCDDFAVLMCSMIIAVGGEARINYAYSNESGHAFTEVNIGYTDENQIVSYLQTRYRNDYDINNIWKRKDSNGNNWLNLDWQSKHPGGQYFKYNNGTCFYVLQKFSFNF